MIKNLLPSLLGAIVFYSTISLPPFLPVEFLRIAIWLPWVGILLASILGIMGSIFLEIGFSAPMTAIILLGLKCAALFSISQHLWEGLILAMSWSRWGQLIAIALYDYLRKEGKGAFLKENLSLPGDLIFASVFIIPVVLLEYFYLHHSLNLILTVNLIALAIALLTGWWFNHQLGGHTGDTYGATVEWSEALILSSLTIFL